MTGAKFDLKQMLSRKDKVVSGMTGGIEFLLKKNKVTRINGFASFNSSNEIKIKGPKESSVIQARKVVIASGSVPIELPFAPFDHKSIVDSTDALAFEAVPKDLVVIGGGVIGLELGSVWNRLGSKVTVIEFTDKILGNTDKQASQVMQKLLEKQGMSFYLNSKAEKIEVKGKSATVFFDKNGEKSSLKADKVLVAVGRKANSENLGLEKIGVEVEKNGKVVIGDNWQSSCPGVYAIGDVTYGPMLAHKASDEGIAVAEHIAGHHSHVNYQAIPNVVYTQPELASVGLSEEACKEQNIPYKVGKFNFKANGRAKAMGDDDGLVKIIAHKETDRLLGFHIVGGTPPNLLLRLLLPLNMELAQKT